MTSPSFNYFYRVELTVVRLGDQIQSGTQTVRTKISKTYNFVSKSLRDAISPSDRETMFPILESVGEVSLNAGEFLPSTSFSSISISNHRGSFGADRRFSDVLQRYTAINQTVNFYVGESDNFTDAPTSWTQIASGQVQAWDTSVGGTNPTLSFQIAPYKISDKVMNLEVSRDIVGMENAPDSSLGIALPIVFNKIHNEQSTPLSSYPQVIPTRISADGAEVAKYALCTLMYNTTKARVMTNYYAKKAWETDADLWTPISFTRDSDSYLTTTGTPVALNTYMASAYRIPEHADGSNATGFVVEGVTFSATAGGSTSRTSNAYLDSYILRVDRDTYSVIDEVARGRVALATYDSLNNVPGTNFTVSISFNQPVVLDLMANRTYDFYIVYEVTSWLAGDMSFRLHPTASRQMVKVLGATSGDWSIISPAPSTTIAHKLRVITASAVEHENTYSKDGFTYASLTLTPPAPDTSQSNPPLDSLSLVALVEGLCKYEDNSRILDANNALSRLSYEWNGEQWSDVNSVDTTTLYDTHYRPLFQFDKNVGTTTGTSTAYVATPATPLSAYRTDGIISLTPHTTNTGASTINISSLGIKDIRLNDLPIAAGVLQAETPAKLIYNGTYFNITSIKSTHRSRYLTGIFDSKVSYSQVISEIARGAAAKIGILSSKKLFMYPWGITAPVAFNIPQADIIPLSWENRDPSTVMNRMSITFDRVYAIEEGINSEDGYAYSIDFSSPSYVPVVQITEQSRALYGVQNIVENKFNVFGYSDYYAGVGMPAYLTGGPSNSQPTEGGVVVFSVDFLAEYYMTRFALPAVYCSFVVPWHRYKNIKMFDVINFAHSEFPAFYGTDPSAKPGVVINGSSTTAIPSANYGQELVRAQTYRGLVEGLSYVMAMEHAPAIRLTVLVLLNTEFDPT